MIDPSKIEHIKTSVDLKTYIEELKNQLISLVIIGIGMMIIAYFLAAGMQRYR